MTASAGESATPGQHTDAPMASLPHSVRQPGRLQRLVAWLFPTRAELSAYRGPLWLCALSGLFGAVLFPPVEAGWLAPIALVPVLVALPQLRGRMVFWGTLLFSSLFAYLNLWWLNTLVVFHPAIPLGILLLGVIVGLFAVPFGFGARHVMLHWPGWLVPWGVAAAWTGSEFLRHLGETAFPWNLLGHSQISGPTSMIAQWAEKGGVPLVSFLVALINGMFAHGIHRWRQLRGGPQPLTEEQLSELRARRPTDDPSPDSLARGLHNCRQVQTYVDCVLTATAIFLFVLTGMGIRDRFERNFIYRAGQPGATKLRVGLIQTNINQLEKMRQYDLESDRARRDAVGRAYVGEALRLARSVAATSEPLDVIIFPEAMFIDPFFVFDESLHELMRQFSVEVGADLLFGADGWEELSTYRQRLARGRIVPEPGQQLPPDQFPKLTWEAADDGTSVGIVDLRNLARFVSVYQVKPREGLVPKVYHKVQLVPFGEHAPLLDWLPFNLAERLLWVAAFQKGTVIRQFESGGVPIGPLICFESTFGSLARDHARAGARVLAVMTNDAWYDPEYAISEGGLLGLLFRIPGLASLAASGPDQHLIQSRFRAIETRLPVVRVANRGRSAVILPDGNFAPNAGPLNFGVQGTLAVTVPIPAESDYVFVRRRHNGRRVIEPEKVSPLTYYVRAGDWAGWGSVIVLAVILLQSTAALVRRRAQP